MRLALVGLALLLGLAGGERTFENTVDGHSVLVPSGWAARLSPDGTTNVVSSPGARLDRRRGAPGSRVEEARQILASIRLTARAPQVDNRRSVRLLGRSVEGRPIRAFRIGNPRSLRRVLVVGCIHGNECAGMAVTQRLVNLARPIGVDLWIVQNLNRDGLARGTRTNARGVDLNRDFLEATQRETRIARKLILRLRPDVTIWFHQPQAVVRAWGPSRAAAQRYARLAGVPYRSWEWPPGSASRWQNGIGLTSFVVELPPGELPDAAASRHARAVLALAE